MTHPLRCLLAACLLAACLLGPVAAAAQPLALQAPGPTRGLALLPTGVALADEVSASEVNPAGLGLLRGPELVFLHERDLRRDALANGLFLGSDLFGGFGVGLGLQWVRPKGAAAFRKTTWSAALGGDAVSLGVGLNLFSSRESAGLDRLVSFDLGWVTRPSRHFSVGAVVRDLDTPVLDGERLPRRFAVGLGVRPGTDKVALGADLEADDRHGLRGTRASAVASVEPWPGLWLRAGLGRSLRAGELFGQVGLTVDGPHVGAGYALGAGRDRPGDVSHLVQARLSAERHRALAVTVRPRYVVVDLAERLARPSGQLSVLLGVSVREPFLELLALFTRLEQDRDVAGVLLKVGDLPGLGLARVEEIRDRVAALRRAGKKVGAVLADGGDAEYLLASAADRIWALPQASLLVNGLAVSEFFFAEGLEKLGVGVDVARVGPYKNAPDAFTRRDMSDEQRQVLDRFLDDLFGRYVSAAAAGRGIPEERFREVLEQGILTPKDALAAGLVDGVAYPDELPERLGELQGEPVKVVADYPDPGRVPRPWGRRPAVGVVVVEGLISGGKTRSDPLGAARVAGAETIIKSLERARHDDRIKAVVLRIDSGGGSGAASDLVWRAARELARHKPLVVSLGDVAASGGYYLALAGQEILASPSTLTGSIGVFAIKPSFAGLLDKVGVREVALRRGGRADLFSPFRPWSDGEREAVQRWLNEFYDGFLTRVVEARGLDRATADALARGRIYSGVAAREVGLVDRLGGLSDAVERAKARAGLAGAEVDVEVVRAEEGLLDLEFAATGESVPARLARELGAGPLLDVLELGDGPLALMPSRVRVR